MVGKSSWLSLKSLPCLSVFSSGVWEESLPQLPFTHMWGSPRFPSHMCHCCCKSSGECWSPGQQNKITKVCHFLDHTEGQAGSGAVAASGFSSCQMGWCPSEWNLFSTDPMPVDKMGTVKYALTSPPATTASHIQVDFSVSSEGPQSSEHRLGGDGVTASI